jgi:hypothetical protein
MSFIFFKLAKNNLFILTVSFVVLELFTKVRLPSIKNLLLVPNNSEIIFKKTLQILIWDLRKYIKLSIILGFFSFVYYVQMNVFYSFIESLIVVIVWFVISLIVWDLKVTISYSKNTQMIFISILVFISAIFTCIIIQQLNTYLKFILLFSLMGLLLFYFYKKLTRTIQYIYDTNIFTLKRDERNRYLHITKWIFLIKEQRMLLRSKRLKLTYWITILLSVALIVLSFTIVKDKHNINIYLYFVFMSVIVFPDYYERFWAWDMRNIFLIKCLPYGLKNYFKQKILFSILISIPIIIIHTILFDKPFFYVLLISIVTILSLPLLGGYNSSVKEMNSSLDISIWELKNSNFNKSMLLIIIPILLINWYVLKSELVLLLIYSVLLILIVIAYMKKSYNNLKNKEY